jgi:hypothetical protein
MASLKPRLAFVASRVAEAFGVDEGEATASVRKHQQRISDFLLGEGANPASHILAYCQPRDVKNEVRARSGGGSEGKAPSSLASPSLVFFPSQRLHSPACSLLYPPHRAGRRVGPGHRQARGLLHPRRRGEAPQQGGLLHPQRRQGRPREGEGRMGSKTACRGARRAGGAGPFQPASRHDASAATSARMSRWWWRGPAWLRARAPPPVRRTCRLSPAEESSTPSED